MKTPAKRDQHGRRVHVLKGDPKPFGALWSRAKRHELRTADRDYQVGDFLLVQEFFWGAIQSHYSGREVLAQVTYVAHPGEYGLPVGPGPGLCILSLGAGVWSAEKGALSDSLELEEVAP